MSVNQKVVDTGAVPDNTSKPFPIGSNSIYTAGVVLQKNQAQQQTTLSQGGGIRKKLKYKSPLMRIGGASPVVVVAGSPSYAVDKTATNANNTQLAKLANDAQNSAAFDNTTSQSQVAEIAAQQQAVYNGKGGKKWNSHKKGGSWPIWGCLSGGKKSRKYKKKCKCKSRKHRKTKHHRRTRK